MSLNLYNRIRKNFSIRLTLWYLAVLIIAYALLFTIAYYSLFSSLKREDEKIILLKFKEYSAEYEKDEITGVEKRINAERDGEKPMPFFVRIADKDNRTLSLSLPDKWTGIDLDVIGRISVQNKEQKTHVFEILSFPLGDGNFMQIGKEVGHREEILAQFRRVFTGVVFPAILISIMGGYLVTFRAIRPIRNLTQTVQSIIDNNRMDVRVSGGKTEDEINGLVIVFNTMLNRIE
ncbi:MAG TPA: HAMP domain-containing protein, partial [Syntrophorhabdaceae bacterium]|nr:HAMP domain-containing protein [Syntrophorhabdaceae bacterium]